jgi:hypothetical protein
MLEKHCHKFSLVNFYNVINENDELFKKQFCISDKKLKLKIQMKLFGQLSLKLLRIIDFFVLSLLQFLNKTLLYLETILNAKYFG